MLLFAPSLSSPGVLSGLCRLFPGFHPCLCLRGFLSSPSSSYMALYRSLLGSAIRCFFSAFSSCSAVLDYFVASSCLSFAVFMDSFLSWGVLPLVCVYSSSWWFSHVWSLWVPFLGLGCGSFCCAFLLTCASAPYCLFRHWVLPSLPSSCFISPCSPSSLFSPLCISFPSIGFSGVFLCPFSSSSFLVFCGAFSPSSCACSVPGFVAYVPSVRAQGVVVLLWGLLLGVRLSWLCTLCVLVLTVRVFIHFVLLLAFSGSLFFQLGGE